MHLSNPLIEHSLRHPMYSGVQMHKAPQTIDNDIINVDLLNTIDTDLINMSNNMKYCKCQLRQNKLLRHDTYNYEDTIQVDTLNMQNHTAFASYRSAYYESAYANGENTEYYEVDTEAAASNLGNLESKMQNLEINSGNGTPESGTSENCAENDENKSEYNEKTEQDLQGNDELNVVNYSYDNEYYFDPNNILEGNEETDVPITNENRKIEIIENIIIRHATNTNNDETLQENDQVFQTSQDNSGLEENESIQTVFALEDTENLETVTDERNLGNQNKDGEINVTKEDYLEATNEIILKQMHDNAKIDKIESIASTSKGITAKNISNLADKSDYTDTGKESKFDDFKVPKKVNKTKTKKVKKQQARFILTHVVEGHIIQESNFAFPVSKAFCTYHHHHHISQKKSTAGHRLPPSVHSLLFILTKSFITREFIF